MRTSGGLWGAPVAPKHLKKSTFWTLSGAFGPPLGAPWRHLDFLGVILGTFRPTFCWCFLKHFERMLAVFWVELEFQIALDLEKSSYTQT